VHVCAATDKIPERKSDRLTSKRIYICSQDNYIYKIVATANS
jgi:hypothetical protein